MGRIAGGLVLLLIAAACAFLWYNFAQGGGQLYWGEFLIGARHGEGIVFFFGMLVAGGSGLYVLGNKSVAAMLFFDGACLTFMAFVVGSAHVDIAAWPATAQVLLLGGAVAVVVAVVRLVRPPKPLSAAGKLED